MSALDDRRQAAREAAFDAATIPDGPHWVDVAIETATRVRITDEIVAATGIVPKDLALAVLTIAFRAAGFETEESAFVCPPWCGAGGPKCANPKHGKPDSGTPITDHVYRGGNQLGDLCNHVYPIEGCGWPGMRCATPERWHHDRHPQQAPRKDTLPS
jgi:hypothetical protein